MSTTIQTTKKTAQLLRELMKKTGAKSYDRFVPLGETNGRGCVS